jgi:D-alanyl-D-alanine carboxypeptidase (penicillin-binding protein 5/6)
MPLTRRQIYRRRRITIGVVVALIVGAGVYLPFTLLAPLAYAHEDVASPAIATPVAAAPAWPQFGASAFGAVGVTGLLGSSGSADPLPIASISKIVTALVTLQAKPLAVGEEGPTITFSAADHALYAKYVALQGTVKVMPTGGTMTEHQVMQVALIASANNYAETLADWAFGSETAYVDATKTWLAANGLAHTTIVEPTGINPVNTSTASDLVALGKLALANPIVAAIVDTPTITLPIVGAINDTNKLLGKAGVVGIKTGTLTTSSLLFASRYRVGGTTVLIVGAVLGGTRETIYPAVSALLKSIKSGYHAVTVATRGQHFATYTTPWGQTTDAVAVATTTAVVWSDTPVTSVIQPIRERLAKRGSAAGNATFTIGTTAVTVRLRLNRSLSDPGPWWRLGHPLAALGIG